MNPYKVLQISKDASQNEIMQAVTKALKRREYTAREIVDAQKALMDPQTRKAAEFIYCLSDDHLLPQDIDPCKEMDAIPSLEILHCFDRF